MLDKLLNRLQRLMDREPVRSASNQAIFEQLEPRVLFDGGGFISSGFINDGIVYNETVVSVEVDPSILSDNDDYQIASLRSKAVDSLTGTIAYHRTSDHTKPHSPIDDSDEDGHIFIYDLTGGSKPINVTEGLGVSNAMNPSFSPDGRYLTFMAHPFTENYSWAGMRIYVLDLLDRSSLMDLGLGQDPKFSPDGKSIIYKRDDQVLLMDYINGNPPVTIASGVGEERSGPNYAPIIGDERLVFWKTYSVNGEMHNDIVLKMASGFEETLIARQEPERAYYPIWQDDDHILFTITENGNDNLYRYQISSKTPTPLGVNTDQDDSDAFPIGDYIGFSTSRSDTSHPGYYDLWIVGPDGMSRELAEANSSDARIAEIGGVYCPYSYEGIFKEIFVDDFEDHSIDNDLWDYGGQRRTPGLGYPNYSRWDISHSESLYKPGDPDAFLQMKVNGPTSGNTYGADAWLRTTYDYNDGNSHLVNFIWQPEFIDDHYNVYFIQVTDGYTSPAHGLHWNWSDPRPETTNLLWTRRGDGSVLSGWELGRDSSIEPPGDYAPPGPGKLNWSITITPSGVVRLYDSSNGSGALLREESLVSHSPWYLRFMVVDGTSSGFPSGDARLNLYSVSSEIVDMVNHQDTDGIAPKEEQGPSGTNSHYDGNYDGTPDWLQDNVGSFYTLTGSYATLASEEGTQLYNVTTNLEFPLVPPDSWMAAPYGLLGYEIHGIQPGEETLVEVYLEDGSLINSYYKYGPTPDNPTAHWYEFLYDGQTGAEIDGDMIRLHFVDGQRGDDDLSVNGIIAEPGGPVMVNHPPVLDPIVDQSINEGESVHIDASFTDMESNNTHTATIDWGDGAQPEAGAISEVDGDGTISGSHVYADSGVYTVSVTVTDSDGGADSHTFQATVKNVAPKIETCNLKIKPGYIFMQGENVILDMRFTDPGPMDNHIVSIAWGDGEVTQGTPIRVNGHWCVTDSHAYMEGGIYQIDVSIEDNDGASDQSSLTAIVSGVGLHDGQLQIVGTNNDDRVSIRLVGSRWKRDRVRVNADFLKTTGVNRFRGKSYQEFAIDEVDSILVYTGQGDDYVYISRNVKIDSIVDGGAGNDRIWTGGGNDIILGRDGRDFLLSGSGSDLVIGGKGEDILVSKCSRDILISDHVAFDADHSQNYWAQIDALKSFSKEGILNKPETIETEILTSDTTSSDHDSDGNGQQHGLEIQNDADRDRLICCSQRCLIFLSLEDKLYGRPLEKGRIVSTD
ncbi:PKD domain-containing protein [Planctomycetota bacterium]